MNCLKLFLFALSFAVLSSVHAKENDRAEDYVVLSNGDKLVGRVQMPINSLHFAKVKIKEKNGKSRVLLPDDLRELTLSNGNHFVSRVHPDDLEKKLFQVVFDGTPSLYKYKGVLYVQHEDVLRKLDLRIKNSKKQKLAKNKSSKYIGILKVVFGETCGPDFHQRIEATQPYEIDIKSLFEDFYQCKGVTYTALEKQVPFLVLSPVLGVNTGSMTESVLARFDPASSITSVGPVNPGLGFHALLDVHFRRDLPRLVVTSGITYHSFQTQMNLLYNETTNTTTRYIDEYTVKSIGIPVIANFYVVGSENFKMHMGFGYHFRTSVKEETYGLGEKEFYGFQRERLLRTETLDPQRVTVLNNGGFLGKVGVTKKITNRLSFVGELQAERLKNVGTIKVNFDQGYNVLTYSYVYYSVNTSIKFK